MQLSYERVQAVLEALSGDDWQWCSEYGEPGYSTPSGATTPMVVLGDYWCHCPNFVGERHPDRPLHGKEVHHPRLWAQLESQGVQFEWYDEWTIDYESDKAYRTSGDSYSWMPSAIYDDVGDLLTPDTDIETWIEYVKNEPTRCLLSRVHDASDLILAGFEQFNGKYESGWYPGQDDDPVKITDRIRREYPDHDIVFLIDANGQFDTEFSSWIRSTTEEGDDD